MKYEVAAGHGLGDLFTVTDVSFDKEDRVAAAAREVGAGTTDHVVEHADLAGPFVDQLIDDMGTDQARVHRSPGPSVL